ncbi:ubiquitinyl hydrolase 1 [Cooperia oncophora]
MGDMFIIPMLSRCVFTQVTNEAFGSTVWEGKNPLLALEVLADLTESCPGNAVRLIEWLGIYFGKPRELEWEYRSVFARLTMTRSRLYVPREMWETFRFSGADRLDTRQQHDAVDFFTELIDRVDSALEKEKKPLLFRPRMRGKFTYEYICYGCFHRHIGVGEDFIAVNLELHGPSLEDGLEHYVNGELLEGENAYFCSKCEEKRNTLRRGSFSELPNTLAIQLKRFSYDINGRVDKKNDYCAFPMLLDMTPYCTQARAVCDQDLKSLFDDLYSSGQEDSASIDEEQDVVKSQESHHSPASPSRWGRKRRKTSSLPSMAGVENYQYELVGVVVHSGGARAGHYVSYVKERR